VSVIWHELECGSYAADLDLWRSLADEHGEPVLDIGAGTGRVALDLARRGHRVTALDLNPDLIRELERRAAGLAIVTVVADAREFELDRSFPLIIVPMQTIQHLGGRDGRRRFLDCARRHLASGGLIAAAITPQPILFEPSERFAPPAPNIRELDGIVYSSRPTAMREDADGFMAEWLRETISGPGGRTTEHYQIRLDRLTATELELDAAASGLRLEGRTEVPASVDRLGSTVVMLGR
jgi:SAM-dependent methyltransferase